MAERFRALRFFWSEEDGQDLIEYSLLIGFVAVACAAIVAAGGSATVPWSRANTQLSAANATAS
jgi:Flp pilus assembly pilin Flp